MRTPRPYCPHNPEPAVEKRRCVRRDAGNVPGAVASVMAGAVIPPAASEPENDAPAALLMVAGGAGRGGPSSSAAKRRGSSAKKSGVKRPPLNLAGAPRIPPVLDKLSPKTVPDRSLTAACPAVLRRRG